MYHYEYTTRGTCSQFIALDIDGDKVKNIQFYGGCPGNLKAISKLCEGMSVDQIEATLLGNTCGRRPTSCADQLAKAARIAYDASVANG